MTAPRDVVLSSVPQSRAWGAVPLWLLDAGVSGNAVALFARIAAKYAPRPGFSAPSPTLDELATECGVTERAVRKWRDELVAVGALHVARHGPRASSYTVAGIGSDGPVSEQPFTLDPPKSGTDVPHLPEQPFRPTSSKEIYKKTAAGVNGNAPEQRPRTDERRESPPVDMYHPDDDERARVRADLAAFRAGIGMGRSPHEKDKDPTP